MSVSFDVDEVIYITVAATFRNGRHSILKLEKRAIDFDPS